MAKTPENQPDSAPTLLPQGDLIHLKPAEIIPSKHNPRQLFDRAPLDELKSNIRTHGVLVPITVYQPKGSRRYTILDGARRHRCCLELEEDGLSIEIPANVVNPPSKIAGLLSMFSIHNFREDWELMPTALALKTVMGELDETDNRRLKDLTGLSEPQIERCKKLLDFPERFQNMSMDPDPKARIPSNFWIELFPVLDLCKEVLPKFYNSRTRDGITDKLVEKYRSKKVKSVIHFRRIMEAFEVTEGERRKELIDRLRDYIEDVTFETRSAFDEFITDPRRLQSAIDACVEFIKQIEKSKVEHVVDKRDEVLAALNKVRRFADKLIDQIKGRDDPELFGNADEE
jgi:ParB/RepB/Spo0J family partition protein